MSLVKLLNLLVLFLILVALYNLFFGIDSKRSFLALQSENQELLEKNNALSNANDLQSYSIFEDRAMGDTRLQFLWIAYRSG